MKHISNKLLESISQGLSKVLNEYGLADDIEDNEINIQKIDIDKMDKDKHQEYKSMRWMFETILNDNDFTIFEKLNKLKDIFQSSEKRFNVTKQYKEIINEFITELYQEIICDSDYANDHNINTNNIDSILEYIFVNCLDWTDISNTEEYKNDFISDNEYTYYLCKAIEETDIFDYQIKQTNDYTEVSSISSTAEYIVFDNYDKAYEHAVNMYVDELETGELNITDISGYEDYVDSDWFEECWQEMKQGYIDDIRNEASSDDEYETRLEEEMAEAGCEDESDFLDYLLSDYQGIDAVNKFIDEFGKKSFDEVILQNNLINTVEVSKYIVDTDDVGNAIAAYDNNEIELDNGMCAYRIN